MAARCSRFSLALLQLHTWPTDGAGVSVAAPDVFIFIFSSASFPAQLQALRLSVCLWCISAGWVCFIASITCFDVAFYSLAVFLRAQLILQFLFARMSGFRSTFITDEGTRSVCSQRAPSSHPITASLLLCTCRARAALGPAFFVLVSRGQRRSAQTPRPV